MYFFKKKKSHCYVAVLLTAVCVAMFFFFSKSTTPGSVQGHSQLCSKCKASLNYMESGCGGIQQALRSSGQPVLHSEFQHRQCYKVIPNPKIK